MVDEPTYRIFTTPPLRIFHEYVIAQIKQHHQPELIPELRHEPIDKTAKFDILCDVDIDPSKRPEQDLAPCPMCQPNKFIHGRLCYFPELQCCAIIGHCCADQKQRNDAEKRFRARQERDWQETYFMSALPLVPRKLEILAQVRPMAEEALRLHKKFHREAHELMRLLRESMRASGGRLRVQFEVELKAAVNDLPGAGRFERLIDANDYGVLDGLTALRPKYDPVGELDAMTTPLERANFGTDMEAIINGIIGMDAKERHRSYVVLSRIDNTQWPRFVSKLTDFRRFFDPENLARLGRWGQDKHNRDQVLIVDSGAPRRVEIHGAGKLTALSPGYQLSGQIPEWPSLAKKR